MNYCRKFIIRQIVKQNSAENFSDRIDWGFVGRIAKDCAEREDETGKKVVEIFICADSGKSDTLGIDAIR